tara:strand:+ start:279 stop:665 length:387 start_codon:yes stop_codon:yes gene_type:complete
MGKRIMTQSKEAKYGHCPDVGRRWMRHFCNLYNGNGDVMSVPLKGDEAVHKTVNKAVTVEPEAKPETEKQEYKITIDGGDKFYAAWIVTDGRRCPDIGKAMERVIQSIQCHDKHDAEMAEIKKSNAPF